MTISLVTGGAGFIGSHLVEALLKRGDTVRVLDDFSTGARENLAGMNGNLQIIEGDICNIEAVKRAVAGVDVIFHHAAFISVALSIEEPSRCFDVNVQGTINVLEVAREANLKKVVIASSAAVYGDSKSMPLQESSPSRMLSPYAASKQTNEVFADLYTRVYNLPVVALRYFNVFGPRQSPDSDYAAAIPIFIKNHLDQEAPTVFGDGGQTRDFVYIDDVVSANLLAAESSEVEGKVFNVCSGDGVSILKLLEIVESIIPNDKKPKHAPARAGDIYHSVGDARLLESVLGFRVQTSLQDGLQKTVDWMRA